MNNQEIFNQILIKSIENRVSDINITQNSYIFLRKNKRMVKTNIFIDNIIVDDIVTILANDTAIITLYKGKAIDGSYVFKHNNKKYFFRHNIVTTSKGIHITIRRLPEDIPSFKSIQFVGEKEDLFLQKIFQSVEGQNNLNGGLYIIAGATGSGKTTTMLCLLDYLMKKSQIKTITIESPIEFYFPSYNESNSLVEQREVGKHVTTFSQGVVDAMRQNPDVIFVGEIRDRDTAFAAYNAALTGHTVFATLHANDVEKVKNRLKNLLENEEDFSLIQGIIHQKLVKKEGKVIAKREIEI